MAKSNAHNLWERLNIYDEYVPLLSKESHVSFTNNRAEQDLRMAKVKHKVAGIFITVTYAEA